MKLSKIIFSLTIALGIGLYLKHTFTQKPTFVIVSDDEEFRKDIKYSLKIIENSKTGKPLIESIKNSNHTVYIYKSSNKVTFQGCTNNLFNRFRIKFGIPLDSEVYIGDEFTLPLFIALAHELQHANDMANGTFITDTTEQEAGVSHLEYNAMKLENRMEQEFNEPIRKRHDEP